MSGVASIASRQFVETVNQHDSVAALVMLTEIGIKGNTHQPFSDLNKRNCRAFKGLAEKKRLEGSA
jgi:hypothetical protein